MHRHDHCRTGSRPRRRPRGGAGSGATGCESRRGDRRRRWRASRAIVDGDRARRPPGVRRVHRLRRAGQHVHRPGAAGRAAARADPLARGRHRRADAPRGRPGDDAAAGAVAGAGPLGRPPAGRRGPGRPAQRTTSRRGCRSTARWAPPATSRRWPTARWCCSARAGCWPRTAPGSPAARRCAAPACGRSTLAAKEGLALINGTDGMLGMLLLAIDDAGAPVHHGRRDRGPVDRGDARLRPAVPAGAARDPAASGAGASRRPTSTGCCRTPPIMDSHRDDLEHAVQDAYSMRCAPQVAGAARDTLTFATAVAERELVRRGQPGGAAGRAGASRPATSTARRWLRRRLPRHRRRRGGRRSPNAGSTGCWT